MGQKKYPPLTPADSALQHSTSELQNLHWAVSYPRFIWEKYSAYCEDWQMSNEGGGEEGGKEGGGGGGGGGGGDVKRRREEG